VVMIYLSLKLRDAWDQHVSEVTHVVGKSKRHQSTYLHFSGEGIPALWKFYIVSSLGTGVSAAASVQIYSIILKPAGR
jgi:hypothetical protein